MAFVAPTPIVARHSSARPSSASGARSSRATLATPRTKPSELPSERPSARPDVVPGTAPWLPAPSLVHPIDTPEQFDHLLAVATSQDALLVVDFMAAWCRKCKFLYPKFAKIAAKYARVYFCSVDVNKVRRLPQQFAIAKMPTFVFVKHQQTVATIIGSAEGKKVAQQIDECIQNLQSQ